MVSGDKNKLGIKTQSIFFFLIMHFLRPFSVGFLLDKNTVARCYNTVYSEIQYKMHYIQGTFVKKKITV